ncbi:2-phosphosulfolactate phosphatase [Luteipulveratus halotolerans]|uniref:Probable 2-phosphosulfolactate phosphatase n=1 Tax=Luteipulveratus halotolerans TaxID=1631356 RepID=A0A0L6CHP1_9MICO|nr:2-phosphosulfolactate phosphatase [Luteipulveratus halotolerans]KNX37115.1 hypothetical protein VV01_08095 [Luteipulveratus halotolerans]
MGTPHSQHRHRIRLDWGLQGAQSVVDGADQAVVVDVLSFTTTLTVAIDLGAEVYPYQWRDESVVEFAEARDARYAVGRFKARESGPLAAVSLSPASLRTATGLKRLVLPSPNGSTISAALRDRGVEVVGACLLNRAAVAAHALDHLHEPGRSVAFVAAGERWPDGSLRPSVEDLWGCGAVLSAVLADQPALADELSPEARAAVAAYDDIAGALRTALLDSASGQELVEAGFRDDVLVAAQLDSSRAVPVLEGERFADTRHRAATGIGA